MRRALSVLIVVAAAWVAPVRSEAQAPAVTVRPDLVYARSGGETLRLNAYLPDVTGALPAVVLVHGGGWTRGNRDRMGTMATFVAERGLAAFSIDYRLAPEHRYPGAVHDVQAAVRWIREHAGEFGVHPGLIGGLGSSSGAHLVALAATLDEGPTDTGSRLRAVVAWSGPMDLAETVEIARRGVDLAIRRFLGCGSGGCASLLREASPISHVDPSDPPMLIANATREFVPLGQAQAMDRALERNGVPHLLVEVPGTRHAVAYSQDRPPALGGEMTVREASVEWLREHLSTVAAPPSPTPSDGSTSVPPPTPPETSGPLPGASGPPVETTGPLPEALPPGPSGGRPWWPLAAGAAVAVAAAGLVIAMRRRGRAGRRAG